MQSITVRAQALVALAALGLFAAPSWAQQSNERSDRSSRPALGVAVDNSTEGADQDGLIIQQVTSNSAADRAGLRRGDVIMRVDGRPVDDHETLVNTISRHRPGERCEIQIMRNGQTRTMDVTLGRQDQSSSPSSRYQDQSDRNGRGSEQQDQYGSQRSKRSQDQSDRYSRGSEQQDQYGSQRNNRSQDQSDRSSRGSEQQDQYGSDRYNRDQNRSRTDSSRGNGCWLGVMTAEVSELTERMRQRLGVQQQRRGLVVQEVMPNSPAARSGLRHGDVITAVNGRQVSSQRQLADCIHRCGAGENARLEVIRNGQEREVTAQIEESPTDLTIGNIISRVSGYLNQDNNEGQSPTQEQQVQTLRRENQQLRQRIQDLEQASRSNR